MDDKFVSLGFAVKAMRAQAENSVIAKMTAITNAGQEVPITWEHIGRAAQELREAKERADAEIATVRLGYFSQINPVELTSEERERIAQIMREHVVEIVASYTNFILREVSLLPPDPMLGLRELMVFKTPKPKRYTPRTQKTPRHKRLHGGRWGKLRRISA